MKHPSIHRAIRPLIVALSLLGVVTSLKAQMTSLPATPLAPPAFTNTTGANHGYASAANDRFIAVSATAANVAINTTTSVKGGVVDIFDATTHRWLRRLKSPAPVENGAFGQALAMDDSRVYISARNDTLNGGLGVVYAFDLATGALRWKFSDPSINWLAVESMAVSGRHLLLGSPWTTSRTGATNAGRVVQLDTATGAVVAGYALTSPQQGDSFGYSLAVDGSLLVVGAYGRRSPSNLAEAGSISFIDLDTGVQTEVFETTPVANAEFGISVAIKGNRVAVVSNYDTIKIYDAITRSVVTTLPVPSSVDRVIFHGDTLAASTYDDVKLFDALTGVQIGRVQPGGMQFRPYGLATNTTSLILGDYGLPPNGTAFVVRGLFSVVGSSPMLARTGDYAPLCNGATVGTILDTCVNQNSGTVPVWTSSLLGASAATAKASLSFSRKMLRTGDKPEGVTTIADITSTLPGNGSWLYQTRSTTARNGLWSSFNAVWSKVVQEGDIYNSSGLVTQNLLFASAADGTHHLMSIVAKSGVAGVTTANDSFIGSFNPANNVISYREGSPSVISGRAYGHMPARFAGHNFLAAIPLQGTNLTDNVVLTDGTIVAARRGSAAPGCGTTTFSLFTGEGASRPVSNVADGWTFRATLNSPLANNEGIWSGYKSGGISLVARKGDSAPCQTPAAVFSKFLRVFAPTEMNRDVLVNATIAGTGTTSANNEGIWLFSPTASQAELLLRKGEGAPGCNGARIGTILRVDANKNGHYVILATLTGTTTTTNLALFTGNFSRTTPALRKPHLALRKGALVDRVVGSPQITSIGFSGKGVNAQGFGAPDISRQLSDNDGLIFTVTFADKTTEVFTGWPDGVAP